MLKIDTKISIIFINNKYFLKSLTKSFGLTFGFLLILKKKNKILIINNLDNPD